MRNDNRKSLDREALKSENNICKVYFKDEYIVDAMKYGVLNKDHEVVKAWNRIREVDSLSIKDVEKEKQECLDIIKKYIKPEYLKSVYSNDKNLGNITEFDINTSKFAYDMKLYCAVKGIGEFANLQPKFKSERWLRREEIKKEIICNYVVDCEKDKKTFDEIKKTFDEIRNKFYETYDNIASGAENCSELVDDLEKFIDERVKSDQRSNFDKLFKEYRYLGGACEFNRENVLKNDNFDRYYTYKNEIETQKKENPLVKVNRFMVAKVKEHSSGIEVK